MASELTIHTELEAHVWAQVYAAADAAYIHSDINRDSALVGPRNAADDADAAVVAFRARWKGGADATK